MDEILHIPQERETESLTARLRAKAQTAGGAIRAGAGRFQHWADAATAGGRRIVSPFHFLAVAAVVGVAAVVTSVYTPAYVVEMNGVALGTVTSPQVFEDAVDRVEARATQILGYDYTLDGDIAYSFALVEQENITPAAEFETYLFDQIGDVMKNYVLTVNGQFIGAAQDRETLDIVLDQVKAPYINENTISAEFTSGVYITHEYTASDVNQDADAMVAALTANQNGQTTYEVQQGDTFVDIAVANGMTLSELEALNPGVDSSRIYIGQIVNVKEEIPFLSVKTVDHVTYTEEIACPVVEVEDDSMYQGESKVLDAGTPGEQVVTADVSYLNGVEQERTVLETQVTREATNKVIAVGTKVRPSWLPTGTYIWPVYGNITSSFGYRSIFGSYSYHSGLDIATSYGTTIKAADGGTVVWSGTGTGSYWSYGNYVVIDHGNGKRTLYAHCSSLLVSTGEKVYQGQPIARVGSTGRSTGNHCHFEIQINGTAVNPLAYLG
ncbi:peptidoglycan DD-metalloendopeptidase family protein [Flavonifractor sp. An4]|uniref:peptidoglycan DD-metalloendopeptidase family protein n=1 Tax=Flavonifractor sp. An4 TaxID=1965634 RepID=UPI000B3A4CB7|nr:peptidoglycan DD-metalloendopeptidase family protein [Flavonifractor sp. An4]OUO17895.1 peptidase M23 [Flavonifractor sp. An4]